VPVLSGVNLKIFKYGLSFLLFVSSIQPALAVDPGFISVAPKNGDKRVAVLANIEIQMSGDLDTTTLTNDAIRLSSANGYFRIKGTFHYDSVAKTISFNPNKPLMHGQEFQLSMSGLKTLSGTLYPDFNTQFSTLKNPVLRTINYRDAKIFAYQDFRLNENGVPAQRIRYGSAGESGFLIDGKGADGNDNISGIVDYSYDLRGRKTRETSYDGAGKDAK